MSARRPYRVEETTAAGIRWIVPPECQGQIVEVAYGDDCTGRLYRRIHDRNDGSISYAVADAADCGCEDDCDCFDPANVEPTAYDWTGAGS